MSTSDNLNYMAVTEKLEAIIEFSSLFSSKPPQPIYDQILVDDPFHRSDLIKRVPGGIQDSFENLIQKFELSLQRVLAQQNLPVEDVIAQYITRLNTVIRTVLEDQEFPSVTGTEPEAYGYSISPFNVTVTSVKVTQGRLAEGQTTTTPSGVRSDIESKSKRRTPISKDAKTFLETVFETKRTPNGKERKIIAERCGLTPLQVRVWFTNKRMRSK